MPKVTDTHDLLLHELGVVYAAEKAIERTLPKLAKEANDEQLTRGFERHLEETRGHVTNLEEAFRSLGKKPGRAKAPAVEGLVAQHKGFAADAADDVQPEVLDLVALSSAAATEHHEIAAYESLITLAEGVGASEIVPFLERNLEQERNMLEQTQSLARRLGSRAAALDEDLRLGVERERSELGAPVPGTRHADPVQTDVGKRPTSF